MPLPRLSRLPLPAPSAGAAVAIVLGLVMGIVIAHNSGRPEPPGGSGTTGPGGDSSSAVPADPGGDQPPMESVPGTATSTAVGSGTAAVPAVTPSAQVITQVSESIVIRRESSVVTVPVPARPPVVTSSVPHTTTTVSPTSSTSVTTTVTPTPAPTAR